MENADLNVYVFTSVSMCPSSHVSVALLFSISHFSSEMLALRDVWCVSGPSIPVSWGATLSVSSFTLLPRLKGPGRDGPELTGFSLRSRPVLPRLVETYTIRHIKRCQTFIQLNPTFIFVAHLFSDVEYLPSERLESESEVWAGGGLGWDVDDCSAEKRFRVLLAERVNSGNMSMEVYIHVICKTVI